MEYRKHTNRNVDNYTPVEFTLRRNTLDRTHTSTKHDVILSMPCITCDSLNWISVCVGQVIEKRGRKVLVIFGNVTTELRLFLFSFAILNSLALLQRSKADKSIRRRLSTAKFCQTKSIDKVTYQTCQNFQTCQNESLKCLVNRIAWIRIWLYKPFPSTLPSLQCLRNHNLKENKSVISRNTNFCWWIYLDLGLRIHNERISSVYLSKLDHHVTLLSDISLNAHSAHSSHHCKPSLLRF